MVEFERKISVGHILQTVVFVGGLTAALAANWLTNGRRVDSLEFEVATQKTTITALQSRFENFETNTNGALGRVTNLLTDMRVDVAKQSNTLTDVRVDQARQGHK